MCLRIKIVTSEGLEQIKKDEGFSGVPYKCTGNKTTIGYGRNLEANPLTVEEAEFLLKNDLMKVELSLVNFGFFKKVDEVRKDVLINMAFNIGVRGLLKFKNMIEAIENDQYALAASEMLNSKWARQVGARAHRLAEKMRVGANST